MYATVRSVSRTRVAAGASGSGILARALGGAAPPNLHSGAVCHGGDAGAGSGPFVRGFAWLGVGGGGGGWGGGGVGETRGLSSSSGALSASSLSDKLAAAHAAATRAARDNEHLTPGEKAERREGVGNRAAGGVATGDWRKTARRIALKTDPEGLLRLVADGLPNFSARNVSHAFGRLAQLCESTHVADDSFRGLMVRVREMCAKRELPVEELSSIMSTVANMRAAGKVATDDAVVGDMLAALEQQVVPLAPEMNSNHVSNTILAFGSLGRLPGAAAWAALEAAVVRLAPSMHKEDHVSAILLGHAKLGRAPGDAALVALEAWSYIHPRSSSI